MKAKTPSSYMTRYELHRVWVVEATLKAGERHLYAKRVMYFDEDTRQIAPLNERYSISQKLWTLPPFTRRILQR